VTPPSPAGKLRFSTKERQRPIEFMLGVMGNSVRVDRENGNAIDLEVVTMAFDSTHRSVATATQSVVTKLSAEMLERTEQTGLGIPEKLALIPGKYEVKFAVRDNLTGRIGTIAMPIELK
jgi:hypothetical protein